MIKGYGGELENGVFPRGFNGDRVVQGLSSGRRITYQDFPNLNSIMIIMNGEFRTDIERVPKSHVLMQATFIDEDGNRNARIITSIGEFRFTQDENSNVVSTFTNSETNQQFIFSEKNAQEALAQEFRNAYRMLVAQETDQEFMSKFNRFVEFIGVDLSSAKVQS